MNVKTEVTENIVTPQICETEDDFVKLFLSEVLYQSENVDNEPDRLTSRMTVLLHDYLALTLTGKIKPYEVFKSEKSKQQAKDIIRQMGIIVGQIGVPTKETEEGKIELDFDTIKKNANNDIIE